MSDGRAKKERCHSRLLIPPPFIPPKKKETSIFIGQHLSEDRYSIAFRKIHAQIKRGEAYQVNFTFPLVGSFGKDKRDFLHEGEERQCSGSQDFSDSAYRLFYHLQRHQQGKYAMFMNHPDFSICSASPECFFELEHEQITCCPMKGTIARGVGLKDQQQAEFLRHDKKNLAENRMIVDLFRNDLGRIAKKNSLRVLQLFELEAYPHQWQMVSRLQAQTNASIREIFAALFPSASITGAPKIRACQIINENESEARGVYCGALGFFGPGRRAQLSTAIRTAIVHKKTGQWRYSVGSGITYASDMKEEYQECLLKGKAIKGRFQ